MVASSESRCLAWGRAGQGRRRSVLSLPLPGRLVEISARVLVQQDVLTGGVHPLGGLSPPLTASVQRRHYQPPLIQGEVDFISNATGLEDGLRNSQSLRVADSHDAGPHARSIHDVITSSSPGPRLELPALSCATLGNFDLAEGWQAGNIA